MRLAGRVAYRGAPVNSTLGRTTTKAYTVVDDLEPQAAAHVGQIIFTFSRLDFLVAMVLRNVLSHKSPEDLNPLISRLGFKERLDALREAVVCSGSLGSEAKTEFETWYGSADKPRTIRNAFVHGRWGIESHGTVFNASTRPGKTFSGESEVYSLAQLGERSEQAKALLSELDAWHRRHVISAA